MDEVLVASAGIAPPDARAETLELKGYEFVKKKPENLRPREDIRTDPEPTAKR